MKFINFFLFLGAIFAVLIRIWIQGFHWIRIRIHNTAPLYPYHPSSLRPSLLFSPSLSLVFSPSLSYFFIPFLSSLFSSFHSFHPSCPLCILFFFARCSYLYITFLFYVRARDPSPPPQQGRGRRGVCPHPATPTRRTPPPHLFPRPSLVSALMSIYHLLFVQVAKR